AQRETADGHHEAQHAEREGGEDIDGVRAQAAEHSALRRAGKWGAGFHDSHAVVVRLPPRSGEPESSWSGWPDLVLGNIMAWLAPQISSSSPIACRSTSPPLRPARSSGAVRRAGW